jgi:hypothetical protein
MRLGPILLTWQKKKTSSNNDIWLIDDTPQGIEEAWQFDNPIDYESTKDTRNALENKDYNQDIEGKRSFRKFATRVGSWWAFMLICIVVAQGSDYIPYHLEMEEFIAVVTTTTASFFGITFVVGRYLYGSKAYESKTKVSDSVAPK